MRAFLLFFLLPVSLGLLACEKPDKSRSRRDVARKDILAQVGSHPITKADFEEALKQLSPYARKQYRSLKRKIEFLENLITFELLVLEAKKRGLDRSKLVRSIQEKAMVELMINRIAQKLKPGPITLKEMREYYHKHRHKWHKPERRRAQIFLLRVPAQASAKGWQLHLQKIQKMMPVLRGLAHRHDGYNRYLRRYTQDDKTRNQSGDIGYSARTQEGGTWPQAVSDAVFALKRVKQITGPIRIKEGYAVYRLTEILPRLKQSFFQARPLIRHEITKIKKKVAYERYMKKLRRRYPIQINQALLSQVKALPKVPKARPLQPRKARPKPATHPRPPATHPATTRPTTPATSQPKVRPATVRPAKVRPAKVRPVAKSSTPKPATLPSKRRALPLPRPKAPTRPAPTPGPAPTTRGAKKPASRPATSRPASLRTQPQPR